MTVIPKTKPVSSRTKRRRVGSQRSRLQIIRDFKRFARNGHLWGNYFQDLAAVGDKRLCKYLRNLKTVNHWPDHFDGLHFEGPWVIVLCTFFEGGGEALVQLARREPDYIGECLCVLSRRRSSENIDAMSRILPSRFALPRRANEFETVSGYCGTMSYVLNVGRKLYLAEDTRQRIRKFAHAFIMKGWRKSEVREKKEIQNPNRRYPLGCDMFYFRHGLTVLKHVGDESSIDLIRELPDWSDEVRNNRNQVIELIRTTCKEMKVRTSQKTRSLSVK